MNDTKALVDRLFSVGERLPESLRQQILARGREAEPLLLELIEEDRLFYANARGRGKVPVHALALLGALGSTAAIPRMLHLLEASDAMELVHEGAYAALQMLGRPCLEPCLAAYAASGNQTFRTDLACVLSHLGLRDERIYLILVERLPTDRGLGADNLAGYGDARALPHLAGAVDEYELAPIDHPLANHDLVEMCTAIEALGGQLTEAQQRKRRRAVAPTLRWRKQLLDAVGNPPDLPPDRPGRNDPCHCGSGKKYKKCHLAADRQRAAK